MQEITTLKPSSLGLEIQRFARAHASTLLATGIEWGLVTAVVGSGGNYLIAAAAGAFLGALMDFALKRQWAFMRRGTGSLRAESSRYVVVSVLSLGWNLLTSYALVHRLHVPPIPGVIVASVMVGTLWNYPLHRLFVFPEVPALALHRRTS
ncbi:MAG: GtrA family protein [Gemmatimonadaceae bacterium]